MSIYFNIKSVCAIVNARLNEKKTEEKDERGRKEYKKSIIQCCIDIKVENVAVMAGFQPLFMQ